MSGCCTGERAAGPPRPPDGRARKGLRAMLPVAYNTGTEKARVESPGGAAASCKQHRHASLPKAHSIAWFSACKYLHCTQHLFTKRDMHALCCGGCGMARATCGCIDVPCMGQLPGGPAGSPKPRAQPQCPWMAVPTPHTTVRFAQDFAIGALLDPHPHARQRRGPRFFLQETAVKEARMAGLTTQPCPLSTLRL
eukprot:364481-Chlamydomonas_euryale.AAC.9